MKSCISILILIDKTKDITGDRALSIDLFERCPHCHYNRPIQRDNASSMSILKISCPMCQHSHDVPLIYLRGESRLLKCAQCEHVWRYLKPLEAVPENQAVIQEVPLSRQGIMPPPLPSSIEDEGEQQEFQSSPRLEREGYKKTVQHYHLDWWLLLIACIIAGFVIFREIGSVPNIPWFYNQAHSFFLKVLHSVHLPSSGEKAPIESSAKLTLNVLTSHLHMENDEPVITVKGEVINNTKESMDLPVVSVRIMDKCEEEGGLCERHAWTHVIEGGALKPGEQRVFESKGPCKRNEQPESIHLEFES